jgi:dihydroneopterin aldolase
MQLRPSQPAAAPTPAAEPLDLIFIEGLSAQTVIGIHDSELHRPQPVEIDLYAGVPRSRACDSDRIEDTIDYGAVRERIARLLREHRIQLLEAFAEAIAGILIHEFGAHWARVKVIKPHKFDDVRAVGVQIERFAADDESDARRAHRGASVLRLIGTGMVPGDPSR